jgi:hypothetical protein
MSFKNPRRPLAAPIDGFLGGVVVDMEDRFKGY